MPRLCFGGSFNPIHWGHIWCSRTIARRKGFERVVLIPSADPPHKPENADLAPVEDRINMCRLAAEGDGSGLFEVDVLEALRPGKSYTLDTVRQLRARWRLPDDEPVYWLIGADSVLDLPTWHKPLDLLREVHFVVMERPGFDIDWNSLAEPYRALRANLVAAPLVQISASEIRQRLREGQSIEGLTPEPVVDYIRVHHLYVK